MITFAIMSMLYIKKSGCTNCTSRNVNINQNKKDDSFTFFCNDCMKVTKIIEPADKNNDIDFKKLDININQVIEKEQDIKINNPTKNKEFELEEDDIDYDDDGNICEEIDTDLLYMRE